MGSIETWSVGIEGVALLILGVAAVSLRLHPFGVLWLALAAFDLTLLARPTWTTWRDFGSYWFFISAMLWIGAWQRGWFRCEDYTRTRRGTPPL